MEICRLIILLNQFQMYYVPCSQKFSKVCFKLTILWHFGSKIPFLSCHYEINNTFWCFQLLLITCMVFDHSTWFSMNSFSCCQVCVVSCKLIKFYDFMIFCIIIQFLNCHCIKYHILIVLITNLFIFQCFLTILCNFSFRWKLGPIKWRVMNSSLSSFFF